MRRIAAVLLAIVLMLGFVPMRTLAQSEDADVPFAARHPQATEIWASIEQAEQQLQRRSSDRSEAVKAIYAIVEASDTTEPGSLEWHGQAFFWRTADGAVCGYNPGLRERVMRTALGANDAAPSPRGGLPDSADVAVFQPYYGIDTNFTTRYAEEGVSIADALGGTCHIYQTTEATIDSIAHALETCAVVIFDSHGSTDYYNGDDCVSYANTSYLCLHNGDGLTDADQSIAVGEFGRYYHSYYGGSYEGANYYCVDGTVLANHMTQDAPNNLLWMAICLGMATDGFHKVLREKGVETVYGYSQSVSFSGDYKYEESFFTAMKQGATVMSAISQMKREYGDWDPAYRNYPLTDVLRNFIAFPIVVSSEDPYPGHGNVDAVQTVYGKMRIKEAGFLYGDVNGNGVVEVSDASLLLRYIVRFHSLSRDQLLWADVNADCAVDATDASEILRYIVRLIQQFPAES